MLFKNLFITILLLLSFTTLNADTIEVKPYDILSEQKLQKNKKSNNLKAGLAVDIKADEKSNIYYTLAYEGDYMFINDYLEDEKQIKNNNIYIGIGYKF